MSNTTIPQAIAAQIEKGVPLPGQRHEAGYGKYEPLVYLQKGESFFIPGKGAKNARTSARALLLRRGLAHVKTACADAEKDGVKGVRIWRTR